MVKQLVVIGDSYCHGVGTVVPFYDQRNCVHAFGAHLASSLGLDYVNLAEPGSSITRAVDVGFKYLSLNKDHVSLLVAGWTQHSRLGFYTDQTAMQILPSYVWLGDLNNHDVWVTESSGVKFVTDAKNNWHVNALVEFHKILVAKNFLDAQLESSQTAVTCFRSWLHEQQISYYDFNVFPGGITGSKCNVTFEDVMEPTRHPTREEQKQFAELLLKDINEQK